MWELLDLVGCWIACDGARNLQVSKHDDERRSAWNSSGVGCGLLRSSEAPASLTILCMNTCQHCTQFNLKHSQIVNLWLMLKGLWVWEIACCLPISGSLISPNHAKKQITFKCNYRIFSMLKCGGITTPQILQQHTTFKHIWYTYWGTWNTINIPLLIWTIKIIHVLCYMDIGFQSTGGEKKVTYLFSVWQLFTLEAIWVDLW